MLSLLEAQKTKLPLYLYAYCLMPNHPHLLVERRDEPISRIMPRLLTANTTIVESWCHSGEVNSVRIQSIRYDSTVDLGILSVRT